MELRVTESKNFEIVKRSYVITHEYMVFKSCWLFDLDRVSFKGEIPKCSQTLAINLIWIGFSRVLFEVGM